MLMPLYAAAACRFVSVVVYADIAAMLLYFARF